MLNPNIEIKKWFYTNLTSATSLVVYDGFAPEGAGNEYIVMTGRTSTQDQGKNGYTNSISIVVDIITKNVSYINTNYPYKDNVYLFSVVYINGEKQTLGTDYVLEPNASNAIQIVFSSILNIETQYVSFALFGPTMSNTYQYCMPETLPCRGLAI